MTDMWIILMYLSPVILIGGFYLLSVSSFWVFCQCFGVVDRYIQNRGKTS
jgi:hypothetical protein